MKFTHIIHHLALGFITFFILNLPNSAQAQYNQPHISFSIDGGCSGNTIEFNPAISNLINNTQTQDSITQVIWNYGDGVIDTFSYLPDTLLVPQANHTYLGSGIFHPSLKVVNRNQLDSTFVLRIVISPQVTPTATVDYLENFDLGPSGWAQETGNTTTNDSLWQWGVAIGQNINTVNTTNKVWGTGLASSPTTYLQGENAWVYSPCFDLTALDRPMIEMAIWRNAQDHVDGAVLQYFDDMTNSWKVLGKHSQGINWYQNGFIVGNPGQQALVPTGWTGNSGGWENVRFRLDGIRSDLRQRTDVRFRIAFASSPNTLLGINDGFAFDSIRIGNRTRNVLVEHFSGTGYPAIEAVENQLYNTVLSPSYGRDVNLIQFHTNRYYQDSIYSFNSIDVDARSFNLGVTDANQAFLNGIRETPNTPSLISQTNLALLNREALEDPKFTVTFQGFPSVIISNSILTATIKIEALQDLPVADYSLFVIVTEDSLLTTTGHTAMAVMRDILPNYAGYTYLAQGWTKGETDTISINWPFNSSLHVPQKLGVTAFIQNINTLEVYQVASNRNQSTFHNYTTPYGLVEGYVLLDSIVNCTADYLEPALQNVIIKFENNTTTSYTTTNSAGFYSAVLDTGAYTATIITPNSYWYSCQPTQNINLNYLSLVTKNWTLKDSISCPLLEVDISAPFLRMTGGGSNYSVSYCNNGTVTANNAYVEVDIDPSLIVLSSSIPIANQSGTVYTFNLGTIDVGESGLFAINVIVDTSSLAEQTHCTEAHIYPDSICTSSPWSGAILNITKSCGTDSVYFIIHNSNAAMSGQRAYFVIEDNIMMRTAPFQLAAGQSIVIAQAARMGYTYRLLAEQETGFPQILGEPTVTSAIEGCKTFGNGSFNTGFITQFSNGHSSPFIAIDCQQNIGSFDPNDKSAQPEGYNSHHYIYEHTALDYRIRFQNTGTDTAFNIVIIDTLSSLFDISSIEMGTSSHPYSWTLKEQNILEVSFNNVMLPDSNVNEPASNGFFRFKIQQNNNNPLGVVINNQASIYFDYNPPIQTNTTFHTISDKFVTISIDEVFDEQLDVLIYPNPFTHSTTIEVQGKEYEELNLGIYDLTGREIMRKKVYYNNKIQLSKGNMHPGIYIYKLEGDKKLINTGKIIVQ